MKSKGIYKPKIRPKHVVDDVFSKIHRDESGCWLWNGTISDTGYGRFVLKKKQVKAHRFVFELFRYTIPVGLTLDHLCRVRHCVNPFHLQPVSIGENVLRGNTITAWYKFRTHCNYGHEFTDDNIYWDNGRRRCRTCRLGQQRLRLSKHKLIKSSNDIQTII